VRLTHITGVDLRLFEFDYDLTWAALFLHADGTVYGRYGSRDAQSAEGRISLAGLRHAMQAALAAHRRHRAGRAVDEGKRPLLAEEYPEAKPVLIRGGCIHCHQVHEFRRAELQAAGRWQRDRAWVYPLPENVGLTLEVDRGNHVRAVARGSPAERAGLRPGDVLQALGGQRQASIADVQYSLNQAPGRGTVPVSWLRGPRPMSASLRLKPGWRKTDITWRPSLLELVPDLPVSGRDLAANEKKALGLAAGKLAFREGRAIHSQLRAAGVRDSDIIVGADGQFPEMTRQQFREYIHRNYLVGDRINLHLVRDGKRLKVPLTLQ
jgi:predicted metalloprotease with PDZ domain